MTKEVVELYIIMNQQFVMNQQYLVTPFSFRHLTNWGHLILANERQES